MNKFKAGILAVCVLPLFAQASTVSRANLQSKAAMGSESGGGGSSSKRSTLSTSDLQTIVETIHRVPKYNFNFIFGNLDDRDEDSKTVLAQVERALNQDPQFFQKIKLVTKTDGTCEYAIGKSSMASYANGVICFDLDAIEKMNYSEAEAKLKLAALYAHEVGHAAGIKGDIQSERLLGKFQTNVEELLKKWDFDLSNPVPPLDSRKLEERLKELVNAERDQRSQIWVCSRLQKVLEVTADIPIRNRQESNGISLMSNAEESLVDLLVWENEILTGLNCDGYWDGDENLDGLIQSHKKTMSLNEALEVGQGHGGFCDGYSVRVCNQAKTTMVKTKPQSLEQFRKLAGNLAARTLNFLKQF